MAVSDTPCQVHTNPQGKAGDLQNELPRKIDSGGEPDTSATCGYVVDGACQVWHLVIDDDAGITRQRLSAMPAAIAFSRQGLLNRY
jgi:hypothetical protein